MNFVRINLIALITFFGMWARMIGAAEDPPSADGEEAPAGSVVVPVVPSLLPRDASLDLPEWKTDDWREFTQNDAPTNLGGGLFPADLWPLMPEPTRLPPEKGPAHESQPAYVIDGKAAEPLPQVLQEAYFGALPPESLVDPQALLNEVRQDEISNFLEEYSTQAAGIHIRVLVIGPTQRVPDSVDLKALTSKWFGKESGILVIYPMTLPEQSICLFSTGLAVKHTVAELTEVREACVKEALVSSLSEDQLARYCIKLAVRINRLHAEPKVEVVSVVPESPPWWAALPRGAWWYGGLVLLAAACVAIFQGRKPSKSKIIHLPDQEFEPRLGAAHSGGTMGIVKFGPNHKQTAGAPAEKAIAVESDKR